jgi:hypothetical protein
MQSRPSKTKPGGAPSPGSGTDAYGVEPRQPAAPLLVGAALVVPSRNLYRWLTDRIGNYPEIEPYLDLWKSIPCTNGVFEIIVIEQDAESTGVPKIPKGTDGRAIR